MTKITIFLVILAFLYSVEALPNSFNRIGMDPNAINANIWQHMQTLMDPNNLKNQAADGTMVVNSARIENGKHEYQGFIASKKNGQYSEHRYNGP